MRYGLALGSNIGDRRNHLRQARSLIRNHSNITALIDSSGIYESQPVDCAPGTQPFYNACLEIESPLAPENLLQLTQSIENQLGRPAHRPRNAPRTIDIDILYANSLTLSTAHLQVPHPRAASRRFVLQPLSDVNPQLILPGQSLPVSELLNRLDSTEPPPILVDRHW